MGALTRYCRTAAERKLIVSSAKATLEQARAILSENNLHNDASIRLAWLDSVEIESSPQPSLVIVFERDLQQALHTSKALKPFKDRGIPVVFGNARDIFFTAPDAREQGLSYAGMFKLCQAYLRGQKHYREATLGYAEFGVFDGRTFSLAWHLLNPVLETFHAFDSFQGILDQAPGEDIYYQTGDYYANLATFNLNMQLCGADMARIVTFQGDFDQDLTRPDAHRQIRNPLAVVHVDCDVYPAALNVLEFVTPHLADGSILLFDDFDSMWGASGMGEKRALAEWQQAHPEIEVNEYRRYSATGRAFLCLKRPACGAA